jgi:hypothetical protein
MYVNGNKTTALMHLLVWTELQRMRVNQIWPITRMTQEQTVLLDGNHLSHRTHTRSTREGKFDFFVETPKKNIGFEVLTRPTKGKILKKMTYMQDVDDFVFVIPHDSLQPYERTPKNHGWKVRPNYLPSEFAQKGLYVWLVDLEHRCITLKKPFASLYFVEAEKTNGKHARVKR